MKKRSLVNVPINEIISTIKDKQLVTSVHVGIDGMYAVAIGRDIILLTRTEMKWFGIGLIIGSKHDIKEKKSQ